MVARLAATTQTTIGRLFPKAGRINPSVLLHLFKMATGAGKWEVAGKDGKARKNTSGNKKNKSKVNEADMPKLDTKG